jgi:hypothetical protein
MDNNKSFIQVEINFDKEDRYGDTYRQHLTSTGVELMGVEFGFIPQKPVNEKIDVNAKLLYDRIDYSPLICGAEFLIKEGGHRAVGQGKVITVGGFNFAGFPMFSEYLRYKFAGERKQAIDKLHYFIEAVYKDKNLLSSFCNYLCKVLDILQYRQCELGTQYHGHWFNEPLKWMLFDFLSPLIKEESCSFEYKKWFCLYARSKRFEVNFNMDFCEQLLKTCDYKDKLLVSYYISDWEERLYFAVHEFPIGYLGDKNPENDLEKIVELRRIDCICFGKEKSDLLLDVEKEIRNYFKL